MFETCKHLYQCAKTAANSWRDAFRQAAANTRYYHSTFKERVERLDTSRANILLDGMSQEQMLEELRDLEQQMPDWDYQRYLLQRQHEFFQAYGDYVLRMLLMTKSGHSNKFYEIPPLDTLKILWGCDPDTIGSHINKDTIRILVDKAIAYFRRLSPPKWTKNLALHRDQTAVIKTFLDPSVCFGYVRHIYTNISTTNRWKG
ncbi:hypothetical protein BGZ82_006329 [Podila clonocystis]|nr:hypothetical protein BGZ82_006329 [Podila clonocystis]